MEVRKFENVRELIDSMNSVGKRIWIGADDPKNLTLRVVDENLDYAFEIGMSDMKDTAHLLNAQEIEVFRNSKDHWRLVKDVKITEHQKYLISHSYFNGMADYLSRIYSQESYFSDLRLNGEIKILKEGELPLYDINPEKETYCFGEDGEELIKVGFKNRVYVPLFEIAQCPLKKYNSVWDVKVDDFITNNDLLEYENDFYERIVKEIGTKVKIIIPIRTPITVLPVTNWVKGEFGFSSFIILGIGVFKQ